MVTSVLVAALLACSRALAAPLSQDINSRDGIVLVEQRTYTPGEYDRRGATKETHLMERQVGGGGGEKAGVRPNAGGQAQGFGGEYRQGEIGGNRVAMAGANEEGQLGAASRPPPFVMFRPPLPGNGGGRLGTSTIVGASGSGGSGTESSSGSSSSSESRAR